MDVLKNRFTRRMFVLLRRAFPLFFLFIPGSLSAVFGDSPPAETVAVDKGHPLPDKDAFKAEASQFFQDYCVKCHGEKKQEGELRLDTVLHDLSDDKTARLWNDIFAQIQFSEMPPSESEQQPNAAKKAEFLSRIEAELMRFGRGYPSSAIMSTIKCCLTVRSPRCPIRRPDCGGSDRLFTMPFGRTPMVGRPGTASRSVERAAI